MANPVEVSKPDSLTTQSLATACRPFATFCSSLQRTLMFRQSRMPKKQLCKLLLKCVKTSYAKLCTGMYLFMAMN